MKAAVFVGPGELLGIREVHDPEPGSGEVVLRVERCGICASDLHMTAGHAIGYLPGSIIGHEVGAEVVALGRDVDSVKVGDFVVPMPARGCGSCPHCLSGRPGLCAKVAYNVGGYAEYMLSSAASCVRVVGGLSLADAALVEPLTVGLHGISSAPVCAGDRVLIFGAGPIGLGAVFWAERFGSRVAVAAPSSRREALARSMGASDFIVMDEGYEQRIHDALGGRPDVVVECVGAPGLIAKAIDVVKTQGTVVVLGLCMHAESFVPAFALFKEIRLQFAIGTQARQFRAAIDVLAADAVKPRAMVSDTISLDALPTAFEALRHRTDQCKVLVAP